MSQNSNHDLETSLKNRLNCTPALPWPAEVALNNIAVAADEAVEGLVELLDGLLGDLAVHLLALVPLLLVLFTLPLTLRDQP